MYVCFFDIDGTLLASGGAGKHAMYAAITSEFGVVELDDTVPFAGRTDRAIGKDLFSRHGIEQSEANWQRFVRAYLAILPDSLADRSGHVLPGVSALLEALRLRGDVAIGLLTGNLREGARRKLSHFGIEHFFGFGGFGDRHLDRDDVAREAMVALGEHLPEPPGLDRVWVIGDTPLDVKCARSIGARCLAVSTGFHSMVELAAETPDLLLADLTAPDPFLAQLNHHGHA